jgi:hypothetical protein
MHEQRYKLEIRNPKGSFSFKNLAKKKKKSLQIYKEDKEDKYGIVR